MRNAEARTAQVMAPGEELVSSVPARSGFSPLQVAVTTRQLVVWRWHPARPRPTGCFGLHQIDHFTARLHRTGADVTIVFVEGSEFPLHLYGRTAARGFIRALRTWMAANPVPEAATRRLPTSL